LELCSVGCWVISAHSSGREFHWDYPPFLAQAQLLAATTQGPISAVVLMMELTGRDRSFMAPLLLAVITATLVSRMIEPRSIYDARLSDKEVKARLAAREPSPQ
jgi:H+/Cl- antiporter ClcA